MTTIRQYILLCGLAALLAVTSLASLARGDEMRSRERTMTEGERGRGPHRGGGRHGGGHRGGWDDRGHRRGGHYHHGGSGWDWAGFGAAVGLGILDAVTNDSPSYTYVEPAPQVVYPATPYYTPYPSPAYVQPHYAQPYYGDPYAVPVQPAP